MRRAAKVDSNQTTIVTALRQVGASVESIAPMGRGMPDILVGFRGKNTLMEIKTTTGKLTSDERAWHDVWQGQVLIVRTPDDALRAIGVI